MGEFIKVEIESSKCLGLAACGQCLKTCPVNIFLKGSELPTISADQEDECTLCELCLTACTPAAVVIKKLYLD